MNALTAGRAELVSPAPATPAGGDRRYIESSEIVRNNVTGAYNAGQPVTATFRVDNPSSKLSLGITVGFRADASEPNVLPTSGAGAWLLTLDAFQQTKDGLWIPGNNIVTGLILPQTYEATTTVRQIRGTVTVPNLPGTGIIAGRLYVIASWEADFNVPDAQVGRIFQACHLTVDTQANVSNTGA